MTLLMTGVGGDVDIKSDREGSLVLCRASQGQEIRGFPQRVNRFEIVFEIYTPAVVLRASEVLGDFQIILGERRFFSGRAVVRSVVHTGLVLLCEAALEGDWLDVALFNAANERLDADLALGEFVGGWQRNYQLSPAYKVLMADMATFLTDLRLWLEQLELGIRSSPSANRARLEREIVGEMGDRLVRSIDAIWDPFEEMAEAIPPELRPLHRVYLRRQLHPLVLCSPFAYRAFTKPLGYAGDYEVVNMITRDPLEGGSLFAKAINLWLLRQPPAAAHRNRLEYLGRKLTEETLRVSATGRETRVLSLGSGPAIEVQRFLEQPSLARKAHFTLVDFNEETIRHMEGVFGRARLGRMAGQVELVRQSVQTILREAGKRGTRPPDNRYDVIYCAGLFDYLSAPVCERLLRVLYEWLNPDGVLIMTNVGRFRAFRHSLEYILDWHLISRLPKDVERWFDAVDREAERTVSTDGTGANLLGELRRNEHAG